MRVEVGTPVSRSAGTEVRTRAAWGKLTATARCSGSINSATIKTRAVTAISKRRARVAASIVARRPAFAPPQPDPCHLALARAAHYRAGDVGHRAAPHPRRASLP